MHTLVFIETFSARQPFNPMKAHMNRYANMLARLTAGTHAGGYRHAGTGGGARDTAS